MDGNGIRFVHWEDGLEDKFCTEGSGQKMIAALEKRWALNQLWRKRRLTQVTPHPRVSPRLASFPKMYPAVP